MPELAMIAKMVLVIAGLHVIGHNEGVGAYYAPGVMEQVCRHRVEQGWQELDCDEPCLVSAIEQEHLGETWLVWHDSLSFHECLVVDVGATEHLPTLRARGEVVEVSWEMAQAAGWDGYQENVRIWRLGMQ